MLVCLFALIACIGAAPTMQSISSSGTDVLVEIEKLTYKNQGTDMASFVAYRPRWLTEHKKKPAIVIVPDNSGLDDYEYKRARMIVAELDYVAVGADIYGVGLETVEQARRGNVSRPYTTVPGLFASRIQAAIDQASRLSYVDRTRIAIYGYCFGGTGVLNYVSTGAKVAAGVAFHPGGSFIRPTNGTKIVTPVLVLAGANDINSTNFQNNIAQPLINASATFELQRFGQTLHAFTRWGDNTTQYNPVTDEKSWNAAKSFVELQFFASPELVAEQQRCGATAKLTHDANGCCEVCKVPEPVACVLPDCPNNVEPELVEGNPCPVCTNVNCNYVDCADPECGENHDVVLPVGSCCGECRLNCSKAKCPALQCAVNERKFTPAGKCCAECVASCGPAGYNCPVVGAPNDFVRESIDGAMNIVVHDVKYKDADVALQGQVVIKASWKSSDKPRPLVVIVHDFDGISSYERSRAHALVNEGYVVFLLDVYGAALQQRGERTVEQQFPLMLTYLNNPNLFATRVLAGIRTGAALAGVDHAKVAVLGYCFGGAAVLNLGLNDVAIDEAVALNVKALISYHAPLLFLPEGKKRIPFLMADFQGAMDETATNAMVAKLESILTNRTAPRFETHRYSSAGHAFTVFNSMMHEARSDARSWLRTLGLLKTAFSGYVETGTTQPEGFIDLLNPRKTFKDAVDIVAYAKAYVQASVSSKNAKYFLDLQQTLLDACTANWSTFRHCYADVREAIDEGRVALGLKDHVKAHRGSDKFDDDSSSSSSSSSSSHDSSSSSSSSN